MSPQKLKTVILGGFGEATGVFFFLFFLGGNRAAKRLEFFVWVFFFLFFLGGKSGREAAGVFCLGFFFLGNQLRT